MKIVDEFRNDSARVLDRLVDGELGPQERRQLLAAFDDEPAAWRNCALAFLESQSWRWQLTRLSSEPILAQVTLPEHEQVDKPRANWMPWLAVAASLVLAFTLGLQVRRDPPGSVPAAPLVTQRDAQKPELPNRMAKNDPGADSALPEPESPQSTQPESTDVPQTLTLTPLGDSGGQTIELPIVESDATALADSDDSTMLSQSMLQQFERDGFRVNRQQRYWPVELPDGRRVVVPVEEVNIRAPEVERL